MSLPENMKNMIILVELCFLFNVTGYLKSEAFHFLMSIMLVRCVLEKPITLKFLSSNY